MKVYFLVQGGAFWIGAHYSTDTKRLCIQLVPFLTICIVGEGGQVPRQIRARQERQRNEN
jgi:hypothetical protein